MAAKNGSTSTQNNEIDYSAIVSKYETEIVDRSIEHGKYLPWTFYKNDIVGLLSILTKDGKKTTTSAIRQYLIKVLDQRIESLPKGMSTVVVKINTTIVKMSEKEEYELRKSQFELSKKSTANGPTITRILGGKGARAWLKKQGFKYDNGFWVTTSLVKSEENNEEKSS